MHVALALEWKFSLCVYIVIYESTWSIAASLIAESLAASSQVLGGIRLTRTAANIHCLLQVGKISGGSYKQVLNRLDISMCYQVTSSQH